MAAHRFRSLLSSRSSRLLTSVREETGFVPCPPALLNSFSPEHQRQVQEIYRQALELTQQAVGAETTWHPCFSLEN